MLAQTLQKLASRKFLMTIAAVVAAITGSGLEGAQLYVVGFVAAAYVVAEALTDRTRADQLAAGVEQGLAIGATAEPNQLTAAEVAKLRAALATARPSAYPPAATPSKPPALDVDVETLRRQ